MRFSLLDDLPDEVSEVFTELAAMPGARIERIVSPPDMQPGEIYCQTHDEWVMILKGWADLRLEETMHRLKVGDSILVTANLEHQVMATSPDEPTVWLAVHAVGPDQSA